MNAKQLDIQDMNEQSGETKGKYLTFLIDGQLFGIPIRDVLQIVGIQEITPIPDYPSYAKGIISLRGTIIPLIDIRTRFGKAEAPYTERTCIIVVNVRDHFFGFIVDEVDEVTNVPDDAISPPPRLSGDESSRYLTGVARLHDKIVLLLDSGRILYQEEFESLAQAALE